MGIEDALCLSTLMQEVITEMRKNSKVKGQALHAAFNTYDSVRRTRSQWVVNSSRRVCDMHQQREWADTDKSARAETCFEEIKDRSLKIWHFDIESMVNETRLGYQQRRAPSNGFVKNTTIY